MSRFIQVLTTVARKDDAERIASALLESRLAACVQIGGPILSRYWWKERLEMAEEWFCLIKTRRSLYPRLEKRLKAVHPYETPEIIAIPILQGNRTYLAWVNDATRVHAKRAKSGR